MALLLKRINGHRRGFQRRYMQQGFLCGTFRIRKIELELSVQRFIKFMYIR